MAETIDDVERPLQLPEFSLPSIWKTRGSVAGRLGSVMDARDRIGRDGEGQRRMRRKEVVPVVLPE